MQHKNFNFSILSMAIGLIATVPVKGLFAQTTTRVNVTSASVAANQRSGTKIAQVSSGGKFVLFDSFASNLDTYNTNLRFNLYLKNTVSGALERINITTANFIADNDVLSASMPAETDIAHPTASDIRFVAFDTAATNLVTGDTNAVSDIFVRDRTNSTTTRISVNSSGVQGNGASTQPYCSANGRYIAYQSSATNLTNDNTGGIQQVFRYDRVKNVTQLVSLNANGLATANASYIRGISADGRLVLFGTKASGMPGTITSGVDYLYIRDMIRGTVRPFTKISLNTACTVGAMTPDARYITFQATVSNLIGNVSGTQIYLYDSVKNVFDLVSQDNNGNAGSSASTNSSISAGGQFVLFDSTATNLVNNDTNGKADIFLRNRVAGTTQRISLSTSNGDPNGDSSFPSLSADGRYAAFASAATNLIASDTNTYQDVFERGVLTTKQDFRQTFRLQNSVNGAVYFWNLLGQMIDTQGYIWTGGDNGWVYRAAPDLNGDGEPDAVFQYGDGTPYYWILNSTGSAIASTGNLQRTSGVAVGATDYRIVAAADLNLDGIDDLILQNPKTGAVIYWLMNGSGKIQTEGTLWAGGNNNWVFAAIADLDGNGVPDLIFQHAANTHLFRWSLSTNGSTVTLASSGDLYTQSLTNWTLKAAVPLNDSDKVALLFQNTVNGQIYQWNLTNGVYDNLGFSLYNGNLSSWKLVGATGGNFLGKLSLYFQNKTDGSVAYWNTNDTGISTSGTIYGYSLPNWLIADTGK